VDITTESIRNGKVIAMAEGMSKKAAKLEDNKVSQNVIYVWLCGLMLIIIIL